MAKVLVVDDNSEVCLLIQEYLSEFGHDIQVAKSGHEAIDAGHLFQPDVLIVDWNLNSDYDGLEVTEAVIAAKPDVKPILISGYAVDQERKNSVPLFDYLSKPFSMEHLGEIVERASDCGTQEPCGM